MEAILGRLLFIIAIIPIHEFAHAYVAGKMGDNTAGYQGRLDLNPLKHIDPIGCTLILLTGFGWAKPVPVNYNNFRDKKKGVFLTAAAGPAANLILAFVALILAQICFIVGGIVSIVGSVLLQLVWTSIYLAVFNLIPLPPLDGWKMASVFIPPKTYYQILQNGQIIQIVFLFLIFSRILTVPLQAISSVIFSGMAEVVMLIFTPFL